MSLYLTSHHAYNAYNGYWILLLCLFFLAIYVLWSVNFGPWYKRGWVSLLNQLFFLGFPTAAVKNHLHIPKSNQIETSIYYYKGFLFLILLCICLCIISLCSVCVQLTSSVERRRSNYLGDIRWPALIHSVDKKMLNLFAKWRESRELLLQEGPLNKLTPNFRIFSQSSCFRVFTVYQGIQILLLERPSTVRTVMKDARISSLVPKIHRWAIKTNN